MLHITVTKINKTEPVFVFKTSIELRKANTSSIDVPVGIKKIFFTVNLSRVGNLDQDAFSK